MRTLLSLGLAVVGLSFLSACTPVSKIGHEYQLSAFSVQKIAERSKKTLMITPTEAVSGYQTGQMLYIEKPYQIETFAKNEWISPPADMLYPLLVQSVQASGYFYAIASSPNSLETDYRLDTQLLNLEQTFLKKPSFIRLTLKAVLTRTANNKIIASRIFHLEVPCAQDSPYGGVLAANKATFELTAKVTRFVISQIRDGE